MAYVVCFGFLNAEYRIALVGFICSSRGRIRKLRFALGVCIGFSQCGIPHRTCRFYLLLAGAVGKRQGISIPYPSPTPLLTPGVSAAAGHDCCRGLMSILDSGIRCCRYSPVPNIVQLSVFGSVSFAFQSGCPAWIVRFSLLVGEIVRTCGYVWFCYWLS